MVLSLISLLLAGCGADQGAIESVMVDSRNEPQETWPPAQPRDEIESAESNVPAAEKAKMIPAEAEQAIWQWLDANIGSQERLAASFAGQRLSGANVGDEIPLTAAQNLLFTEQLQLLYAIRKSRDPALARQYMLVHTLMTIDQAEHTRSVLPANDPRLAGVLHQIATGEQLLAAIGYDRHAAPEEAADPSDK